MSRWIMGLALSVAVLTASCAPAPQAPSPAVASGETGVSSGQLDGLVSLAVQRITTADEVAAAKFGTGRPIDDPARERQVLDAVAAQSQALGIDPAESTRFFQDQIEANKVIQRGLHQQWAEHPESRPNAKPDLTVSVRPRLDQLTTEIIRQLQVTAPVRHAGQQCVAARDQAFHAAVKNLDPLHREALTIALQSVCG